MPSKVKLVRVLRELRPDTLITQNPERSYHDLDPDRRLAMLLYLEAVALASRDWRVAEAGGRAPHAIHDLYYMSPQTPNCPVKTAIAWIACCVTKIASNVMLTQEASGLLVGRSTRLMDFYRRGPDEAAWVHQVAPGYHAMAQHWRDFVATAERGDEVYVWPDGGYRYPLRRLRQEIEYAPADQFRYLQRPTLVLQGERDLNVSPADGYSSVRALREAGNSQVTLVMVPRADHAMRLAPDDMELRLRQRISLESYRNPTSQVFLHALTGWLLDTLS